MSVYVDGSIVEVYANDELAITTRAYPWLLNSTGCGVLMNGTGSAVKVSNLELWDGLVCNSLHQFEHVLIACILPSSRPGRIDRPTALGDWSGMDVSVILYTCSVMMLTIRSCATAIASIYGLWAGN